MALVNEALDGDSDQCIGQALYADFTLVVTLTSAQHLCSDEPDQGLEAVNTLVEGNQLQREIIKVRH